MYVILLVANKKSIFEGVSVPHVNFHFEIVGRPRDGDGDGVQMRRPVLG